MRSKKAIYNIVTNLVLQIVTIIYGFIVPKIIINNFGSNTNGLISSITQFLSYITLLESGFGPVVKSILYKPISKKDNKSIAMILKSSEKFFRKISYIFLIYIFLLCLLYPILVKNDFSLIYTISLICIISISTFAEYYFGMTYRLFLQAEQKTYIISIVQTLTYFLSIILILFLAKLGFSIHIIKLVAGIIFIIRPIFQNFYVKKKYNINLKNIDNNYEIKQKWDGLAQHIAAVIHSNTDITVLTIFCSLVEVSVYSVYYLVVKGIKLIIQAFSNGVDASFGDMIAKNEQDNLKRKFNLYEMIYFTIITIIFSSTMILITPFISVYTRNITDVNYIRLTFGVLLVISEYIWAMRLPYSSITLAAGHFKETKNGAWLECFSNIVLSVWLVYKYGIIGVTIGTIVAMLIRTIEFIYHANKYILFRNVFFSIKKVIVVIFETVIILLICNNIPYLKNVNYLNFFINSLITLTISIIVVVMGNTFLYKSDTKYLINYIKLGKLKKRKKNERT